MLTVSDVNFFFPEIKFSDFTVIFFPVCCIVGELRVW